MNDTEFHQRVDEQMQIIEESIDDSGADIDYEVSGNVMTLEFEDRSQIIINRQEPMHEIWLASKSGGFLCAHVRFLPARGSGRASTFPSPCSETLLVGRKSLGS